MLGMLAVVAAYPLHAQRGAIELTADLLDRFLRGYDAEQAELTKVDPQIKELDDKIRKFRDCKIAWEIAAAASGSAVVGLAAGVAIRVNCGATNESGFVRDRERIQEGPEKAAMTAGAFAKVDDYRRARPTTPCRRRGCGSTAATARRSTTSEAGSRPSWRASR
jgi:hypothetical protein